MHVPIPLRGALSAVLSPFTSPKQFVWSTILHSEASECEYRLTNVLTADFEARLKIPHHSLISAPLVIETKIRRTIFTTCSQTNGQTPLPTSLFGRVQSKSHFSFSTLVSCLLNHEVFSSHRISALEKRSDRLYWPFQSNWCDFSISKPMSLLSGR